MPALVMLNAEKFSNHAGSCLAFELAYQSSVDSFRPSSVEGHLPDETIVACFGSALDLGPGDGSTALGNGSYDRSLFGFVLLLVPEDLLLADVHFGAVRGLLQVCEWTITRCSDCQSAGIQRAHPLGKCPPVQGRARTDAKRAACQGCRARNHCHDCCTSNAVSGKD